MRVVRVLALVLLCATATVAGEGASRVEYRVEPAAVFRAAEIVRARLAALGVGPDIAADSSGALVLNLPADRADELRPIVEARGRLEFLIIAMPAESPAGGPGRETEERKRREAAGADYAGPPEGFRWIAVRGGGGTDRLVEAPGEGAFTGADLDPASLAVPADASPGGYVVRFSVRKERARAFGDFTEKNVKRILAIVVDGELVSAPVIQERLPGRAHIAGGPKGFTETEARRLAAVLAGGELPAALRPAEAR